MKLNKYTIAVVFLSTSLTFNCVQGRTRKNTSRQEFIAKENATGMLQWHMRNKRIYCVVTPDSEQLEEKVLHKDQLSFYEKSNNGWEKVHEFEEMDFLEMFQLFDGNLITLWSSGTGYLINIFAADQRGKIEIVLRSGAKIMPEIVDIDGDDYMELLLSSGSELQKNSDTIHPEITNVYEWDGNSYKLVKTVPWKTRYENKEKVKK